MAAGLAGVLALAYFVGLRERQRVGVVELAPLEPGLEEFTTQRPGRLLANAVLTSLLLCGLVMEWMPLPVLFMLAFGVAALLNYPQVDEQRARVAAHAPNALAVAGLIFAAGAFTGVLGGTGMLDAMSATALQAVPPSLGGALAPLTAAASLPLTFFLSNDAFYYGMLPVLAKAGAAYGIEPVAMARAALVGQPFHLLSPLVPSTWLLVGLAGVDFADHQRRTWLRAAAVCLLMLVAGVVAGAFPLLSRAG
jgi:CitMHS family citrate-Mg2+:H+ or citrate-Ca2+:H+ symporter